MSRQAFAILNLLLIAGAAGIGVMAFVRRHPDVSRVRGSRLLGPTIRAWHFSNLQPFEDWFVQRGVSPAALSLSQLAVSVVVAAAYAAGLIFTAGFLVLLAGTLDILDGRVARRTSGGTRGGAFLDSVVDRYAEFVTFAGMLVFFNSGWHVWIVLLAVLGGVMVSYTRARAEGLGVGCEVGLLQRPERFVLLGFGSIFSSIVAHVVGLWAGRDLLVLTIILLAVLSNLTALQRVMHVRRVLAGGGDG